MLTYIVEGLPLGGGIGLFALLIVVLLRAAGFVLVTPRRRVRAPLPHTRD